MAWIIGWDLILEYGVSIAAVAVGWGGYFNELLDSLFGVTLPEAIATPPGEGGTVNVPAAFLVLAVTALLIVGVRESARTNTMMVGDQADRAGAVHRARRSRPSTADNFPPFFAREGVGATSPPRR